MVRQSPGEGLEARVQTAPYERLSCGVYAGGVFKPAFGGTRAAELPSHSLGVGLRAVRKVQTGYVGYCVACGRR